VEIDMKSLIEWCAKNPDNMVGFACVIVLIFAIVIPMML